MDRHPLFLIFLFVLLAIFCGCEKDKPSRPVITPPAPFNLTGTWEVWHKKKTTPADILVYEYDTDTVYVLKLSFFPDKSLHRFTLTSVDTSQPDRFAFLLYETHRQSNDTLYEFPDSLQDPAGVMHGWNPVDSTFSPPYPVTAYPLDAFLAGRTDTGFTEVRNLGGYIYTFYFRRLDSLPKDLAPELAPYANLAKSPPRATPPPVVWDNGKAEFRGR